MKPTKNRVYCKDSGRPKMLFETENKANTFIKFNSQEIETECGYSPSRSYFCIFCNGWHVTSKTEHINIKSKTEIVLELRKQEKEKRAIEVARNSEIRKTKKEALNKIDELIETLEADSETNQIEILKKAFDELEIAKKIIGSKKREKFVEDKLNDLRKRIEFQ